MPVSPRSRSYNTNACMRNPYEVSDLYNAAAEPPFTTNNTQDLVRQIQNIDDAFTTATNVMPHGMPFDTPGGPHQVLQHALDFMMRYSTSVYGQLGRCAWAYACAATPTGAMPWRACVENVVYALRTAAENPHVQSAYAIARDTWQRFTIAVTSGCGGKLPDGRRGAKWVIQQTPTGAPFYGRTVCMPTHAPAESTRRMYATIGECEMALQQLPPQQTYVPITTNTACNEYGCFNQVRWGRTPQLTSVCIDDSGTCGPTLELGKRVWYRHEVK